MNKIVIPWPANIITDFRSMVNFFEEIGIVPAVFIMKFIFDHGTDTWSRNFGDVEYWVIHYIDGHLLSIEQKLVEKDFVDKSEYYHLTCYLDRLHEIATGDDPDFEDLVYGIVGILMNYYSYISLPEIEGFDHLDVLEVQEDGGVVILTLAMETGDKVNAFYNRAADEALPCNGFPVGKRDLEELYRFCG